MSKAQSDRQGAPKDTQKPSKKPYSMPTCLRIVCIILGAVVVFFISLLLFEVYSSWDEIISIQRIDIALKVIGGSLAAIAVYYAYRRVGQLQKQTENQIQATEDQTRAINLQERGQVSERIKTGLELLSSKEESIRLGAVSFFDKLARDAKGARDDKTVEEVFNMLCGYVRSATDTNEYQWHYRDKPSATVQEVIDTLFKGKGVETYAGKEANLSEANLAVRSF